MTKSNEILEALKMQPLTEEEKASRHILGRWYGPIATCNESTRNGRRYNRELWEKALNDDLFHEKIANKCLFLELGHPIDREETDMSKVCACIPEMPKIINGDLCACVDILDTPNGRILKTLCDYGFVPGVSSRGSGDVMPNDDVDPETFFLETFDCVAIPAVKKARLSMCESLEQKNTVSKLRKALTESFNKASEAEKAIMKETFENLDIEIVSEKELKESEEFGTKKVLTADDIPWAPDEDEILVEEMPAEEENDSEEVSEETEEESDKDSDEKVSEEEADTEEAETSTETEIDETDNSDEVSTESEEDSNEESEENNSEKETIDVNQFNEVTDLETVGDALEMLQEYDDDVRIELEPVNVNGTEYTLNGITSFVDSDGEKDTLVLGVTCDADGKKSDDTDLDIEAQNSETDSVETIEEIDDEEQSADEDGDVDVIESLKEMIRQKEALETEISDLRKAKSVGDAKEQELREKLARYRTAFKNTSAEAAKVPELLSQIKELTEQLTKSNITINALTEKVKKAQQLKESVKSGKTTITELNEQVNNLTRKAETLEAKLEGQTKQYTTKLQERTDLAKAYKARFIETLTRYVESKASMLGVQPSEITSRLNENYTLADVDTVCDQILNSTINFSRLPFSGRPQASVRIAESVSKQISRDPEYGYEIDDDLLELAGLKK